MRCRVGTDRDEAVRILRGGGLVAVPTETVYGLAGHALDPAAVARIFEAKQRPWFDPLIVHVPDVAAARHLVAAFPPAARALASAFWPGPLTLVLPKRNIVPDLVTAGLPQVAVRVPQHPLTLDLLRVSGLPLAAPSANLFGQLSPTTAAHVVEQLGERIDYVLDGGPCRVGVESTVVLAADDGLQLLRPGGLPLEEIERVAGAVAIVPPTSDPGRQADSQLGPGMLPQHYAPRTPLVLRDEAAVRAGVAPSAAWGLLARTPADVGPGYAAVEVLSHSGDLCESAAAFFAALRRLDGSGVAHIAAVPFPETGLGRALNDRLRRAAAGFVAAPPT